MSKWNRFLIGNINWLSALEWWITVEGKPDKKLYIQSIEINPENWFTRP
jgi:hypothetical protein